MVLFQKPIATLREGLPSVDLDTKEPHRAQYERSDVTAVPACGVIAEAMLAFVLAGALLEKTGGDSMDEVRRNLEGFLAAQTELLRWTSPVNRSTASSPRASRRSR